MTDIFSGVSEVDEYYYSEYDYNYEDDGGDYYYEEYDTSSNGMPKSSKPPI